MPRAMDTRDNRTGSGRIQHRREFLRTAARGLLLGALAALGGWAVLRRRCASPGGAACGTCPDLERCTLPPAVSTTSGRRMVWQLDPSKCIQCGRCAVNCVLSPSAVKCVHRFEMCGYCRLCFGFFQPGTSVLTSAAENQTCPTGAIRRRFVESPFYEYTIDESLCIGCGRCVKTCGAFGNGSLALQVRHDRCVNCNECAIARKCPAGAYTRVPAGQPYLFKPGQTGTQQT
ncbi:MAG: 4Fe-4S binding protein [bacterium]